MAPDPDPPQPFELSFVEARWRRWLAAALLLPLALSSTPAYALRGAGLEENAAKKAVVKALVPSRPQETLGTPIAGQLLLTLYPTLRMVYPTRNLADGPENAGGFSYGASFLLEASTSVLAMNPGDDTLLIGVIRSAIGGQVDRLKELHAFSTATGAAVEVPTPIREALRGRQKGRVQAVFHPNGQVLYLLVREEQGGSKITAFDWRTGVSINSIQTNGGTLVVSPGGERLYLLSLHSPSSQPPDILTAIPDAQPPSWIIRSYDTSTMAHRPSEDIVFPYGTTKHGESGESFLLIPHPDGRRLCLVYYDVDIVGPLRRPHLRFQIRPYDLVAREWATSRPLDANIVGTSSDSHCCAFSPDGRTLYMLDNVGKPGNPDYRITAYPFEPGGQGGSYRVPLSPSFLMVNREGVLTAVFRHLTQEAAGLLVARSVPPEKGIAFANFGGIDQLVALPAPKSSERPIGPTPTAGLEEAVRLLTLRDGLPVAETLKTLVQELAKALDPMTVRFFSLKPGGDLPDEGIFGEALFFRDMDTLSIPIRTASSVSAVEKQLAKALKQDWERLGTFDPPVTHYRIYRMAKDLSCVPVVSHLASARLSVLARLSETHPEVFSMDEYAAAGVIRVGILPSRADLAYQLEIGKYEQLLSVIDESIRPRYAALTPAERRALSDLYGSLQILAKEADFQRAAGLEGPVREFGSVDELLEVLRKEGAQFSADDPAIAAARLADARAIDFPSAEVPESQWPSGSKSDGLIVVYTTAGWHETIRAEVRQWRPVRAPNDMWLHFYPEGVKVYPLGISPDRPLPAGRMVGIRPRDASPMAGMPNLVLANPSDVTRLNPGLLYSIGMNVAWNDPTFPIVSVFAYTDAQGRDRFAIFL